VRFLVTGGAGFIGSAVVRHLIENTDHEVHVVDSLTYAGNLSSLYSVENSKRYSFSKVDICNVEKLSEDVAKSNDPSVIPG
jgi:dTDP-glucose 4,6-dehydratase